MIDTERKSFVAGLEKDLETLVDEKRRLHILSTRNKALEIADMFISLGENIDVSSVETAALLHDVTKRMDQSRLCEKYKIELTDDDVASPQVLHAFTGAYYAREVYGVSQEIFSAIYNHTVGSPDMSLLDKIIFVSDYTEDTRSATPCILAAQKIREIKKECEGAPQNEALKLAHTLFDRIVLEILENTAEHVRQTGRSLHGGTLLALEYYREQENKRL